MKKALLFLRKYGCKWRKAYPTTAWQTGQIQQVLRDFPDMFSDLLGTVVGVKHDILTPPGVVISTLYRPVPLREVL